MLTLTAFGIGFSLGAAQSLDMCIDIGLRLLELNQIEINIDEETIKQGIHNYQNRIAKCFYNGT